MVASLSVDVSGSCDLRGMMRPFVSLFALYITRHRQLIVSFAGPSGSPGYKSPLLNFSSSDF